MNNFCVCGTGDYDFDASDCDSYWMCKSAPVPEGTKCCECGAPIPAGGRRSCATHYEVIDTPEGEPPEPPHWNSAAYKAMPDDEIEAMEKALEDFRDAHGWDYDTGRYIAETGTDFRCDRCEGEVEILAQFDVCVSMPGELPGALEEHYWHAHKRRIRWRAGANGVLQPQPWRVIDYVKHYRHRAYWAIRHELTWKLKYRLKHRFGLYAIERSLTQTVARERWRLRHWKWQMQRGASQ